jgi:hypothetical protein
MNERPKPTPPPSVADPKRVSDAPKPVADAPKVATPMKPPVHGHVLFQVILHRRGVH